MITTRHEIYEDGTETWYGVGIFSNLLCKINPNGNEEYGDIRNPHCDYEPDMTYYHREKGPAFICANGNELWAIENEAHRKKGPAFIYAMGEEVWCQNGEEYRVDDDENWTAYKITKDGMVLDSEDEALEVGIDEITWW